MSGETRSSHRMRLIKGVAPQASIADKIRHVLKELKKRWRNPQWWKKESLRYFLEFYYKKLRGNHGIYVLEEDWDNLIILDACRYDVLKEVMGHEIDHRISRGSTTREWILENFPDDKYSDIVYVTANPWVSRVAGNSFYKTVPAWKDGWDEELGTVPPQTMTEFARRAAKEYPDKRLIIHYIQPHPPYIAESNLPKRNVTREVEMGNIDPLAVRDVYKRSLEITLPYVLELANELEGKTVITADHGQLFGKKILFMTIAGHPWGVFVPELIKVPWVVFAGTRRSTKVNKPELRERVRRLKQEGKV